METSFPGKLFASCLYIVIVLFSAVPLAAGENNDEFDEQAIIERLRAIEKPLVEHQYNSVVRGYLKSYLQWNRERSERILGRTVLYFPIFEESLRQNNLPDKLKYLSVVESALNPHAVSRVGAVGLWQFMPYTAKDYGLEINEMVDERRDPHKSTQAAIEYLSRHYDKYNDWALTLAAYNAGAGRVNRAIKRGRSKNFWAIRRYLPRETRNYVPAFIAATYLMEHFKEHDIQPEYPALDMQITETVKVHHYISFHRIAQVTGLDLELIAALNPAYQREIIPASPAGHYLILPRRVMQAFRDYLEALRPDQSGDNFFDDAPFAMPDSRVADSENYIRLTHRVKKGETLSQIAKAYHCSAHQIKVWNRLSSAEIKEGQALTLYRPREIKRFAPLQKMEELPALPSSTKPLAQQQVASFSSMPAAADFNHLFYVVPKKSTLEDLSRRLPGVSLPMLIDLNRIPPNQKLRAGTCVKVPK
jgi:membrane-bound lytic murein transglycosylase D